MNGSRWAPVSRWMRVALAVGVLGACESQVEEESPLSGGDSWSGAAASLSENRVPPLDPYADAVVQSGVVAVINPNNAVGPPDGNVASFLGLLGGSLLLDMGEGEEGTGPLRIYYRGVSLSVLAQVDFLRADMTLISTGQATLLDLGVGTHSALVPFSSATPYRYVRLRGGLASLYSVDAVEDMGFGGGAFCGNGQVEAGEQCDDGNLLPGDGCGVSCQVEPGYTCTGTQPSVCVDDNECANGTALCSPDATCTNTPGSYTCTCNSGYTGTGWVCTDIDECTDGTAVCQPGELCVNTPGSYTCVAGACQPPSVQCGSQCVNVTSDPSNCGACGNVCGEGETCSASACVPDQIDLQIATSWARSGDGDLVVRTPSGKLIHKGNRGPGVETDYGSMDRVASTGWGPERVIWYASAPPPPGQYDVCFYAADYDPAPSMMYPVSHTVIVKQLGQPDLVVWRFAFAPSSGTDCSPSNPSYVTSFTYPGSP